MIVKHTYNTFTTGAELGNKDVNTFEAQGIVIKYVDCDVIACVGKQLCDVVHSFRVFSGLFL